MKPLSLAKRFKVIRWSVTVLVLALAGLLAARLLAKGFSEIFSLDALQIVNISVQLFAIINPFSALPTFLAFTDRLDKKNRMKVVDKSCRYHDPDGSGLGVRSRFVWPTDS
jgi:hypothetical protein